jgi:iron complex transport system substrate-binding protein
VVSFSLLLTLVAQPTGAPEHLGPPPAARATRIVSLAPSFTELLFAMGAGDQVVGVTRYCDWPAEATRLPRVGGFVDPDSEAVLALHPDLVVAAPARGARARLEQLARLGAPVLVLPTEGIDDLWQAITVLGEATGRGDVGRTLLATLREQLAQVRRETRAAPPVRVALIVGVRPLVAAGPHSFLDAVLHYVNAENVIRGGGSFVHLDLEALAAQRPEVIIDASFGEPAPAGFWTPLSAALGASAPRVTRLSDERLVRPGPRLPEGLRSLAKALRP